MNKSCNNSQICVSDENFRVGGQTRRTAVLAVGGLLWLPGMILLALAGSNVTAGFAAGNAKHSKGSCYHQQAPFPSSALSPPPAWGNRPLFRLSQNYPSSPGNQRPWFVPGRGEVDFRQNPDLYLRTIFHYCCEGNVETDWNGAGNPVRKWYHAPWMHFGPRGREPIHGLTNERVSEASELGPGQTTRWQNYAVALYNQPGGWTLGQIWANHQIPDVSKIRFPAGTVAVKLLFTQATVDQVPYLKNAKVWPASIYRNALPDPIPTGYEFPGRMLAPLRLLQIDIAVCDPRAPLGWVFGTFVYDGAVPSRPDDPFARFVPVGLMVGNDPNAAPGDRLHETWINPVFRTPTPNYPPQHLGWGCRLNGPVDNPLSSCLSCHQTAEVGMPAPLTPVGVAPVGSALWKRWFRNLVRYESFMPNHTSCDNSLQAAAGLQNFYNANNQIPPGSSPSTPEYRVSPGNYPQRLR